MALWKDLPKTLHIYGHTRKMREETTAEKQPPSVRAVVFWCTARIFGAVVDGVMWHLRDFLSQLNTGMERSLPDQMSLGTPGESSPPKT